MIEVLPAIIPRSFEDLQKKVARISPFTSLIHLDVVDGVWVPAKSWPYLSENDENFTKIVSQEMGLPEWETLDYEAHLMVSEPTKELSKWIDAGAKKIVIQIEAVENMAEVISMLKEKYGYSTDAEYTDLEFGISIKLNTPLEAVFPFVEQVHFVQCMGISRVGYQGQVCDPQVFERISILRKKYPDLSIGGDGGVTLENAHEWVEAGATRLVSGSAIFESENISKTIQELKRLDENQ